MVDIPGKYQLMLMYHHFVIFFGLHEVCDIDLTKELHEMHTYITKLRFETYKVMFV